VSELDRLAEESRELKWRLRDLFNRNDSIERRLIRSLSNQAQLEQRLHRVEDSVVFRFLQWLGSRLRLIGVSVDRGKPTFERANEPGPASDRSYSNWVEEVALRERIWEPPPAAPVSPSDSANTPPRISILLQALQPNRERLERTLRSIDSQQYSDWELLVCTGTEAPEWLESSVKVDRLNHAIELVGGGGERGALQSALAKCRGEFVAFVPSDAILEPRALERWITAAGPETVAVYCDWDHIDADGRRHTPRFTPELSPDLLSHTLYWGRCYLARTAQVRATNWPGGQPEMPLAEHDLALRLAQRSGSISRVPRMLWHLQDGAPSDPKSVPGSQPGSAAGLTASVIICSRNPEQLSRCLKALMPTLDRRHEVIVVAHYLRDRPALEQVAANYKVRTISYEGAFHFGTMNGLGVDASRGQVICLLNDDVYPIASNWLELMLPQAMRPEVGVVGALLLYPDGTIQHAGVAVGGWHTPAHVGRLQIESAYWPWLRITREVTAVTGACMLVRRSVWDELGGLDPRFPVNYNDIDFCLRAGERGYRVLVEAQAVLTHEESRTRIPNVRKEESELFFERWSSVITAPDKFFNPQLGHDVDSIELPAPWTLLR
jgi:GT2 family glycosyltransferase